MCVCVCVYTHIYFLRSSLILSLFAKKTNGNIILQCHQGLHPPDPHTYTDAGFFTDNQRGPLSFHFRILFQPSLKGLSKPCGSFIEIKGEFLLYFTYFCRKKNKIKKSCEKCSIIFWNLNLLNYLLKQPIYIKI